MNTCKRFLYYFSPPHSTLFFASNSKTNPLSLDTDFSAHKLNKSDIQHFQDPLASDLTHC